MHPLVEPLAWMLGTWVGEGRGVYPSIDDFTYRETIELTHAGKPVIVYSSCTRSPGGRALHSESGFWRPQDDGTIEVVLAHSFGLTEVMHGTVEGTTVRLRSIDFLGTPSAKRVDGEERVLEFEQDVLRYEMSLDFGGHGMQNHLAATLRRTA